MADEPTMGEIMRRLDEVVRQLANLTEQSRADRATVVDQMRKDRQHADDTFLRSDVYGARDLANQAVLANIHGDIAEVKRDRESDRNWRRQFALGLGLTAFTALVTIAIALTNLLAR